MTLLFKVLNNSLDNDIVFYGALIGIIGAIGYSFTSNLLKKSYVEKGVQTDAGNNLSEIDIPDNVSISSTETISPSSYTDTSSIIPRTSEVGIQTIAGDVTPVNIPNPDNVGRVIDLSNAEYIAAKVEQLNALDPFLATPWTPERVSAMIDTLGIVNNLFN